MNCESNDLKMLVITSKLPEKSKEEIELKLSIPNLLLLSHCDEIQGFEKCDDFPQNAENYDKK